MPRSVGFAKSEHSCNFWNLSDTELMALLHFGHTSRCKAPVQLYNNRAISKRELVKDHVNVDAVMVSTEKGVRKIHV